MLTKYLNTCKEEGDDDGEEEKLANLIITGYYTFILRT